MMILLMMVLAQFQRQWRCFFTHKTLKKLDLNGPITSAIKLAIKLTIKLKT